MKKVILFDIDHTLVDTKKLRKYTKDSLIKSSLIRPGIFNAIEDRYIKRLNRFNRFEPNDYLKYISKHTHVSFSALQAASYGRNDIYKHSLFPHTVNVLQSLAKNYVLGIFSEGDKDYQLSKLIKASIIRYFHADYIFIGKNKLSSRIIKNIPSQSVIIDNDRKILETLSKKRDIVPIWLTNDAERGSDMQTITGIEQIEDVLKD